MEFYESANVEGDTNYNILETDYENYAIVYSCKESLGGWLHNDYLWVLSREEQMEDTLLAQVIDSIETMLPRYDVMGETHKTYQGDWCHYDEMPLTPDPQKNKFNV